MSVNDFLIVSVTATYGEGLCQDRDFTVKRADNGTFCVVPDVVTALDFTTKEDPAVAESHSGLMDSTTTLASLCTFLMTDASIRKVTLRKSPFDQDTEIVAGLANRILQAHVSNVAIRHRVVTLEGLCNDYFGLVLKDCSFPEKAILTLGLRDVTKVPDDENFAALAALQPSRLGIRLLQGVPANLITAMCKPLQANPSF